MRRERAPVALLLFIVLALALVCHAPPASSARTSLDPSEQRKPFSLELPDLQGVTITAPEARLPPAELHRLKLHVRQPYPDAINYGKVLTAINGEAAGTIQSTNAAPEGFVVTCDLDSKPRFRLRLGKNVVEITATDRKGQTYYASYVLLLGGGASNADDAEGASSASSSTFESVAVTAGSDRQPPFLRLLQPRAAVHLSGQSLSVKVSGIVTDDSGAVASVSVNSQPATLAPAAAARGIELELGPVLAAAKRPAFGFERVVVVNAGVPSIIVEARDGAGNLTRVTIPVMRRTPAVSQRFTGRKFALVVGVSRYKFHDGWVKDLTYADADARSVRDFLLEPRGGGFQPGDVSYLENEQATLAGVREELARLSGRAGTQDLVFIFIAAHGGPDRYALQDLYFLLNDTKLADMPGTALPMKELRDALDMRVRAERVVVLIDTCHSAGLSGEPATGARGDDNNLINLYATKLFAEKGRAVIAGSDVNEPSWENRRWGGGHGVFTWALLEGLRGEADVNADQLITAGELFSYVSDRVRFETAFHQNPRVIFRLNPEFPLAFAPRK
jgi:hypothetical protein